MESAIITDSVHLADDASGIRLVVYTIPRSDLTLHDPALAPDGGIWYTDTWNDCIGRLEPESGRVAEHTIHPGAGAHGLTVDDNGIAWYAATADRGIGRVEPASGGGAATRFAEEVVGVHTVLASGDHIWFTAPRSGEIGRIDRQSSDVEVLHTFAEGADPYGLAAGRDGSLWVTLTGTDRIVRIDPAGTVREWALPHPDARPWRIALHADGRIWYTDRERDVIGELDPTTREIREHSATSDRAFPRSIAIDAHGRVWWYEEGTRRLVVLDPSSSDRAWLDLDLPGAIVRHMVADLARGGIWLALGDAGAVAYAEVDRDELVD